MQTENDEKINHFNVMVWIFTNLIAKGKVRKVRRKSA